MSTFGQLPAFPQSVVHDPARETINQAADYYCGAAGLNIRQYAWLQIVAGIAADPTTTREQAVKAADDMLPLVLARLEELA